MIIFDFLFAKLRRGSPSSKWFSMTCGVFFDDFLKSAIFFDEIHRFMATETLKKNGYTLIKSLTPSPSPTGEGSGMFARS